MCRRINKHQADTSATNPRDTACRRTSHAIPPLTDRALVLDAFEELVEMGHGAFEDVPDTDSRILYLNTGEVYWLGAHEITRIR